MLYSPLDENSYLMAPIWEILAAYVSEIDNLIIAEMDGLANEIEGLTLTRLP